MNIRNIGKMNSHSHSHSAQSKSNASTNSKKGNQSKGISKSISQSMNAMSMHSNSLMSPMTKQSVMRKVLNNEFNPKLSLSPSPGSYSPNTSASPLLKLPLSDAIDIPSKNNSNDLQTPIKADPFSTSSSTSLSASTS